MIKAIFGSLNGAILAAILGLVTTVFMWDSGKKAEQRGAATAVATINTQTKGLTDAALKARAGALRPGAAERLRTKHHCRDC